MWKLRNLTVAAVACVVALGGATGASADAPEYQFLNGTQKITRSGPAADLGGGHADLDIEFALEADEGVPGRAPSGPWPATGTRTASVELPNGLVGNPTGLKVCSMDFVLANEDILNPAGIGKCPREAAVGWVVINASGAGMVRRRLWRVATGPNEAAAFATSFIGLPIRMAATVSPSGGYRITATGDELTQAGLLIAFRAHLWAVPALHQADPGEFTTPPTDPDGAQQDCDGHWNIDPFTYRCQTNQALASGAGNRFGAPLPGATIENSTPFLSNGSVCDSPLEASVRLVPWGPLWSPISEAITVAPLSDCDQQPFEPSFDVTPTTGDPDVAVRAGQPTGLTVGIDVPQNEDATGVAAAHVKDVTVRLPAGVAISPPSANGLDACTDAQLDLNGDSDSRCPDASKIGTLRIDTPLLEDPVPGTAYLGEQLSNDPESGEMYRLFLVAKAPGVLVKLKGAVAVDAQSGQITTTFQNNPQMPFSRMELKLDGGNRASLVSPKTCGTYTANATFTSYAGHSEDLSSSFAINDGCPTGQFAPTMTAGTVSPLAGSFSPFSMTVNRSDADQDLSRLNLEMPSGLLAALGSVPLCGEAQANAGTCSNASRIGSTSVLAGTGAEPLPLDGSVYVTGPYKGAPFGLSVVVPAKVGPFDLGDVVVRAALRVDANAAKATAVTDPFPRIVGGVPVRLRQVNVTLDRPGFTFNATSCAQQNVIGGFWSTGGATAIVGSPYQAQSCDQLRIQPRLGLQWVGKTQMRKDRHPGLKAQLGDMLGQANLKKVKVTLPLSAALDPKNAKALCEPSAAAANNCPADSRVGWASASTPALHERVQGPVYFVRGVRFSDTGREVSTLPKLYVPLAGQGVQVDLWADSDVDSKKRLVSTFMNIPDVPVRDFEMSLIGGKNGILKATNDVCGASKTTTIEYAGHNGGVTQQRVAFTAPDCKPQIVSAENSRNRSLPVRVGGIGSGTLTLTGKGIGKSVRKVVRSDAAVVRATLSANARHHLRSGKSFRTRLTVRYKPTKGKAINIRKTVRVAPAKR